MCAREVSIMDVGGGGGGSRGGEYRVVCFNYSNRKPTDVVVNRPAL